MRRVAPFDARAYHYYYGRSAGSGGIASVGGAFSPLTLSPVTWVRIDDLGLANDAAIATATDLSGNGNHWTQGSAGARPLNKTNVVNGHAVARFDGTDDFLSGSDFSALAAGEIFIVVKIDTDPPGAEEQSGLWWIGDDTNLVAHYPFTDGVIYDEFGTNARKTTVDPTPSLAAFRLYNVVSASGEWTSFLDGTQLHTTGTNTVAFNSTPTIGKSKDGSPNRFLDGDIAEFILFNAKLSAGNKAALKSYFASRYALTIA